MFSIITDLYNYNQEMKILQYILCQLNMYTLLWKTFRILKSRFILEKPNFDDDSIVIPHRNLFIKW